MCTPALSNDFPDRLLAELPAFEFQDYATFEAAFVAKFNSHLFDLPSGYRWRDALTSVVRRGLVRREGGKIVVYLD